MKTSVLLAVSALLAPGLGSVLMAKSENQMNQYPNMNECNNHREPIHRASPRPNRCYDMEDNYQAFYYQYGDQYRPQMYTERGCRGRRYDPPKNRCCDRGRYNSYMMGGYNNPREEDGEEKGKVEEHGDD
ncbi:hypothetical protein NKR19_g1264 [Coniochaeta hoffmannii]|uniref:Uncharacterized protein n=1 Tax=Coniochaeta hoffmannii TaxID=91930 RepID=A0AA38SCM6_9PEZI|nr:hypothetical protein NKR19_g1264 [Coniochaeta hoffmannii]